MAHILLTAMAVVSLKLTCRVLPGGLWETQGHRRQGSPHQKEHPFLALKSELGGAWGPEG